MKIQDLHSWKIKLPDARALQKELSSRVKIRPMPAKCKLIAAGDCAYNIKSNKLYAAVVVVDVEELKPVEVQKIVQTIKFPYLTGLLSFREAPPLLKAFEKLKSNPDLVIVDGQGLAHPRRFGLACHLGLFLDRPTIGVAKSLLIGEYEELGKEPGSKSILSHEGETIGMVLRSKAGTRPLYISVGHKCELESAVELVYRTCRGYRLPEPARYAHKAVNAVKANRPVDFNAKVVPPGLKRRIVIS